MAAPLGPPEKKRKVPYDRANLVRAFEATRSGMSVYRAARQFSVPESTLRDRHLGLVSLDATKGFKTLFTKSEEETLVNHATYMTDIGYGYSKSTLQHVACEYAKSLGKDVKCQESLSSNWYSGLLQRWPTLRVKKKQKLSIARAKAASREALDKYYDELNSILTENDLHDMPQNIYNIEETGLNAEHSPPEIICQENTTPQNITSTRSQLVTIIAAGNAIGNSIPPYYVYPGVRWNANFLTGAYPGSAGEMSKTETEWSNSFVFENYLKKHFIKFAAVSRDPSRPKTLILYDGHRSHTSLMLTDWAKENNVILFVLPPHTSDITQPLDVGVLGPFESMFYAECQKFMQRNPGRNISKYDIAVLTHKPYLKALSAENLTASFRKIGIHPHKNKAVVDSQIAPSTIYTEISECPEEEPQSPVHSAGLSSDNVQGVSSMKCLVLRLCPGQEIVTCLQKFVTENHLQAAFIITCVGSVTNAKLRMADSTTIKIYSGHYEIVSLVGTLSPEGFHLHGSFSNSEGEVIGGHVVEDLFVYTTAEIVVGECSALKLGREHDEKTGYKELSVTAR